MSFSRAALVVLVGLLATACASPAITQAPSVPPAPSPSAAPASGAAEVRIEVELNDQMRIEPASIAVPARQPVTFVVTNVGQIEHEFYLGDESAQMEHEEEMMSGEMPHGHPNALTVAPGATEELTFTFMPGQWLAGCHIPGHYPAGMKATISIQE